MSRQMRSNLFLFSIAMAAGVFATVACGNGKTKVGPSASPTVVEQQVTPPAAFATELAGTWDFYSIGEAETRAGYRVLRVDVSKFPVTTHANTGFVETFPEVGLPRVRQSNMGVTGHETALEFTQEPDKYAWRISTPGDSTTDTTFGSHRGTLWQFRDQICFSFPTGELLEGSKIIAHICGDGGGYSVDDIRHFVEALYFGS